MCKYAQNQQICRENSKVFGHFCVRRKAANFCHPGLDHFPVGIRGFSMNSNDPVSPACMKGHSAERPFAIYPSWSDMSRCQLWWCSRTQRTLSMGGKNDLDLMGALLIRWIAPELEHNGNGRGAGWLEAHYRRRKRPRLTAGARRSTFGKDRQVCPAAAETFAHCQKIFHHKPLNCRASFSRSRNQEWTAMSPIVMTPNPDSFSAMPRLYI